MKPKMTTDKRRRLKVLLDMVELPPTKERRTIEQLDLSGKVIS
jgi:hypothetical protein